MTMPNEHVATILTQAEVADIAAWLDHVTLDVAGDDKATALVRTAARLLASHEALLGRSKLDMALRRAGLFAAASAYISAEGGSRGWVTLGAKYPNITAQYPNHLDMVEAYHAAIDTVDLDALEAALGGADGIADQPPPVATTGPAIWPMVIADVRRMATRTDDATVVAVVADMAERDAVGRARYGVPLQAHNGRDAAVDAYQEALDACVYLRQGIEEGRPLGRVYALALELAVDLRAALGGVEAAACVGTAPNRQCQPRDAFFEASSRGMYLCAFRQMEARRRRYVQD